jgi:hypothetical protein
MMRGTMGLGKWTRLFWTVIAVAQLVLVCVDAYLISVGELDPTPGTVLKLLLGAGIGSGLLYGAAHWRQQDKRQRASG